MAVDQGRERVLVARAKPPNQFTFVCPFQRGFSQALRASSA
jgi:hypothetical protein